MDLFNPKLALPYLAATALLVRPTEDLRYGPPAGVNLSRTWTHDVTSETLEHTFSLMGQEQSIGEDVSVTRRTELTVRDRIHGVEAGRPTRLDRTLVGLERDTERDGSMGDDIVVRDRDGEGSALLDQTVTFAWDADAERFQPRYAEGSRGEPQWLEGLSEDMDLRAFLPAEAVEPGATWEVEAAVLDELLQPGGRFGVSAADGDDDEALPEGGIAIRMPDPGSVLRYCDLPGEVTVRFVGVVANDDGRFAELELKADVGGTLDVAETLDEEAELVGQPANDYDEAELERTLEGRGVLLWDLAANRMHSVEFEAETSLSFSAAWTLATDEIGLPIEVVQRERGTLRIEAKVSPVE